MSTEFKLIIPKKLWHDLILELKVKGNAERESAAFLLGTPDSNVVQHFICLDDLDPKAFSSGIIVFRSIYYTELWRECRERGMRVMADIHTHPGKWTGQSVLDEKHPMISQRGHIAFIVPSFAKRKNQLLAGVGIYEYLGDYKWKTLTHEKKIIQWK